MFDTATDISSVRQLVFNSMYWVLAFAMYDELAFFKYKAIGADDETLVMYRRYELFSALKKLDVQFSLIILATGVVFLTERPDETVLSLVPNIALLVIEFVWEWVANTCVVMSSDLVCSRVMGFPRVSAGRLSAVLCVT